MKTLGNANTTQGSRSVSNAETAIERHAAKAVEAHGPAVIRHRWGSAAAGPVKVPSWNSMQGTELSAAAAFPLQKSAGFSGAGRAALGGRVCAADGSRSIESTDSDSYHLSNGDTENTGIVNDQTSLEGHGF